eukprot:5060348-Pyramimonas_sp.AAC.1
MKPRGGTVDVRWTKGHPTQAQCQDMVLIDAEVYLNTSADFFAGKAADAGEIPEELVRRTLHADEIASLALCRLLSVQ